MTATISGDGTSTLINLTTSGNTILGDASTDTLNVGNGGLVKDASGNVGIGRASPAARLHLSTTSGNTALTLSTNNNDNGNATLYNDATYFAIASNFGSTGIKVRFALATPDNAMTLDSNGNLFVGTTTTPSSSNAGIRMGPPGANFWVSYNSGTTAYNQFLFGNANGQVGLIQTSGSSTTYSTSSDYRLKEDIAPMTGALAKVTALKPCTYKWKVDGSDGQGFIAHELQEVVAGCVTGEKDEIDTDGNPVYQGIDTSFLVATLTAALQELKALVDTQASTITALQADVEALKAQP